LLTTNFDLLFEECSPNLRSSGPPNLPDPQSDLDFQGIVHLHGRVDAGYQSAQDEEFVVSSADFGRAYLSARWATRFIQRLLSRFQILFILSAASASLKIMASAVLFERHPFERTVRWRMVANELS
jgi:hypothetical protein